MTPLVTAIAVTPLAVPVLAAAVYALAGRRPATAWVGVGSAALVLLAAILLARAATTGGGGVTLGGLLLVDPVSAFMLIVIGALALVTALATPAHLATEIAAGRATARTAARHGVLVHMFLAAMALAVLAADLGVLWVAVEATTIVTAFLVGQRRNRPAIEAAWKYVVICSAGIALALLGLVVLNYAALQTGTGVGLSWTGLSGVAGRLDPGVTRLGVALLLLGFGTKAGLAPLHAWLPDAHSQAPAPVSALMSGVLLSVAFSAILRIKVIADVALGPGFVRVLLLAVALATLVVAASLMLAQRDLKRMLAYSSMEHMGLLALGAAVGGSVAIAAVLLHILGHGLAKTGLFLGAGRVLQTTGTTRIQDVRALAARQPLLAGCLGLGVLALVGLPPFSLFASELAILRAGFAGPFAVASATAVGLLLLLVVAAALVGHTSRMLLGAAVDGPGAATAPIVLPRGTAVALVVALVAAATLGIAAGPLTGLIAAAAQTLTGVS